MKRIIILIFQLWLYHNAWSQINLEGLIVNKATNQPVVFANVYLNDKPSTGTISNEEGRFQIISDKIDENDTITVSHINYLTDFIPVTQFKKSDVRIALSENVKLLDQVQVNEVEDDQILEEIVQQTKAGMLFPATTNLYYREMVKENKSFNKFSDGLLTAVFERVDGKNEIKVKVNQSRAIHLPKDEDDQFEMVSPVKIESVLGSEFGNFLNRFRNENKVNYHYYSEYDPRNGYILYIEPKKEAARNDDQLLYRAIIKAGTDKIIREVKMEMDSLCHFEKSILGLTYSIAHSNIQLSVKDINHINYVSYARFDFGLNFSTKKFKQAEHFVSEFAVTTIQAGVEPIQKSDVYKKSSLFKAGTHYTSSYWQNSSLPLLTSQEAELFEQLNNLAKKEK